MIRHVTDEKEKKKEECNFIGYRFINIEVRLTILFHVQNVKRKVVEVFGICMDM